MARGIAALILSLLFATCAAAEPVELRGDGTTVVPALEIPGSPLMSEEGNRSRIEHISTERSLKGKPVDAFNAALFGPRLGRTKGAFDVMIRPGRIGGVPVLIYEPRAGIPPERAGRTLIEVHGGGFVGCFVECGGLESIPVAALTGMRVVSVDYRLFPAATFPAASEDVEAVYRALLKTESADRIGIFGCSAGGVITGQSLARFHAQGLPQPAAAGIFCAGADPRFRGDSAYYGMALGDGEKPSPSRDDTPRGYMAGASLTDPAAYPTTSDATLAAFPPTLVIVGTRDFAMSEAVNLHRRLIANHVDARLHMWDGGRHAFFYDIRVPEAREAFQVIADFFVTHLKG